VHGDLPNTGTTQVCSYDNSAVRELAFIGLRSYAAYLACKGLYTVAPQPS